MSASRPGEITYYEELGVEESASADEIRDAFRSLVRLLHPDQQSDPQLRDTAEGQMRKLNRVYSVLSDPSRRTAYDEALAAPRSSAPIIVFSGADGNVKKLVVRVSALAAIIVGSVLLIWFMATGNNGDVRGPDSHASAAGKTADNPDDAGDQLSRLRDQLRTAETERDSALEQLGRIGGKPAAASPKQRAAPAPGAPRGPAVNPAEFAGRWANGKTNGSASPGGQSQYPPEFIELTVTERDGTLHGQYHSRYQVLDHAISPDVDFTFNGAPAGYALDCPWQGPGGARGRVTMRLLPSSAVEVVWNATELGSQQALVNGTATLIRKPR